MMHNSRLASLIARKAQLEAEVMREVRVPMPDQLRLATLKKRKLIVKEEIERLSRVA